MDFIETHPFVSCWAVFHLCRCRVLWTKAEVDLNDYNVSVLRSKATHFFAVIVD